MHACIVHNTSMKTVTFLWHCTDLFNDWHDSFKYPVDYPASIPSNVNRKYQNINKSEVYDSGLCKIESFWPFQVTVFKINSNALLHWTSSIFRWAASKIFAFSFPHSVLGDNLIPLTSKDLEIVKNKKTFCIMLSDFRTSFALSSFW